MFNNIYQILSITADNAAAAENAPGIRSALAEISELDKAGHKWLIESGHEDGLNVHYNLVAVYPKGYDHRSISPWPAGETCSHCQGRGFVYDWSPDNAAYETTECGECRNKSPRNYDHRICLLINDGVGGQRVIRKSRTGRLSAGFGLRGDLIVSIAWVDELPPVRPWPANFDSTAFEIAAH